MPSVTTPQIGESISPRDERARSAAAVHAAAGQARTPGAGRSPEPGGRADQPGVLPVYGGSRARLGTSRIESSPPQDGGSVLVSRRRRRQRFARRATSSALLIGAFREAQGLPRDVPKGQKLRAGDEGWVRPPRPARCNWRASESVEVHGGNGTAHYSGTERCGSIHACPVCSGVIRPQRATEVDTAVRTHQANGGTMLFVTLTARHKVDDQLGTILDAVLTSWTEALRSRQWRKYRENLGLIGYIRSVEITYSRTNGWHPHIHALLFLEGTPSPAMQAQWGSWLRNRWADLMEQKTGRRPDDRGDIGVNIKRANSQDIAGYLTKIQEPDRVGQEMARSDLKTGRGDSLMPFELLDSPGRKSAELWVDYYRSTKGRRAITWSHGLKDIFGINEVDDQEIVDDAEEVAEELTTVDAVTWDRIKSDHQRLAAMLEAAEIGDVQRIDALARAFTFGDDGELLDRQTGQILDPRWADPSHS